MPEGLAFSLFDGASLNQGEAGGFELLTPPGNFRPAAAAKIFDAAPADGKVVGARVVLDLELVSGKLGAFLTDGVNRITGSETVVEKFERQRVVIDSAPQGNVLLLRSLDQGQTCARIYGVSANHRRHFDIGPIFEEVLPHMLRGPSERAIEAIASALTRKLGHNVTSDMIAGLDVSGVAFPVQYPSFETIFDDEFGRLVLDETYRLTDLLPKLDVDKLGEFMGALDRNFFALYFRETTTRVYHTLQMLKEVGVTGGMVLEIGTLMGNFSSTLQRQGYHVTAVDRYKSYEGAMDAYLDRMRSLGVNVQAMTREDEAGRIEALGQYDVVLCMAVIEHIPPPARQFMEMLKSHVKPGGILLLDTPNIVRWWNRKRLAEGRTIHQDLKAQYHTDPPWEGHHREYTPDEMVWMMRELGCEDVRLRMFDYNLLQYEALESNLLPELVLSTMDPSQADTIMVAGRIPENH
ncbi:MAG: methyltransferase domain-containing protein [Vulcanimicrobiaceae bacterium]